MTTRISVPLQPDNNGMLGRQCPIDECGLYFKLRLGTGRNTDDIRCPYCRSEGQFGDFFTQDQLEYARSVAIRRIVDPLMRDFRRDIEGVSRRQSGGLLQLKVSVNYKPISIYQYWEKRLETEVICENCTLEFAVYGVFASCPCCGDLNAMKVLLTSLETAKKKLQLSNEPGLTKELSQDLVKDALIGSVSAFDAYGKAISAVQSDLFSMAKPNPFQDIEALDVFLSVRGNLTFEEILGEEAWNELRWFFQARHVYVHNAGVIDGRFVSKLPRLAHMRDRILPLETERLKRNIDMLEQLSRALDKFFKTI